MRKIVVMGVAGCGKSTLGARLATALACPLIEGDDYHLPRSQDKMRDGIPLQEADRLPWLDRLAQMLAWRTGDVVLTCCALKRAYRNRLRSATPDLRFVWLEIDVVTAARRVASGSGHLFPTSLVTTQFAALEPPAGERGVLQVAAELPASVQRDAVLRWLGESSPASNTSSC